MNMSKLIIAVILVSAVIVSAESLCETGNLSAGTAKIEITPKSAVRMSGYDSRKEPSRGVHDPLYARVLVLESNGLRVGIISCDLIKYTNARVLRTARERYDIPYLLICSTHTHSGPLFGDYLSPDHDSQYARSVEKTLIEGLEKALENMFPARVSAGERTFPQIGYNRLTMRDDGHARASFRNYERIAYGPVDPEVGVMKIEDANGTPRAILMMYACHAVANGINYEISADYPGVAARKVEEAIGGDCLCMFVQGGAGNINPLFMAAHRKGPDDPVTTDYTMIEKMGTLLAHEVIKTAENLSPPFNESASLKAMSDSLKFRGRFNNELSYSIHFTTMIIGDRIAVATFPGEPFVGHQLFWKEHAGVPHPFFFGYTFSSGGDFPGYVPDIRSAAYGGYGADNSALMIEVGAGEAVMNRHLGNLYRLRGIMRDKPGPN